MTGSGFLDVVKAEGSGADLVRLYCGGCAAPLGFARTGLEAVAVIRDQADKLGAVTVCGSCVTVIASAVRSGDPHQRDAAAQRLTAMLANSEEGRQRTTARAS